jgi:hypothetical protein
MVNEDAALLNRRVTHMTPAALFSRRLQTCQRSHKHIGNGRKNTNGTISTGDF